PEGSASGLTANLRIGTASRSVLARLLTGSSGAPHWRRQMDRSIVKQTHPRSAPSAFSYDEAFCRNLGWLTEREQQILRGKCVAIAGMGGVGGGYLLTLTRLGVGAFRIADLDRF